MNGKVFGFLVLVLLLIIGASSTMFVVDQRERALVLSFGKVKTNDKNEPLVYDPGLHFRMPFMDTVVRMDTRVQNMEGDPDRVGTNEKKDVIVDSFVKWRIKDFSKFYLATSGNIANAELLLERQVDQAIRNEFGTRTIHDLVAGERLAAMTELMEGARKSAEDIGVEIVDVRIKQINLPDEVSDSVFARMISERKSKANEFRFAGQKEANIISTSTDAKVRVIKAEADRESRRIRGEGDATAAKIYADTYKQNAEFYSFLRSLDAYKATFKNQSDMMVVQPDSDFFRYMKDSKGK